MVCEQIYSYSPSILVDNYQAIVLVEAEHDLLLLLEGLRPEPLEFEVLQVSRIEGQTILIVDQNNVLL